MTQLQINHITKNAYEGMNQGELLQAKNKYGYKSNEWLTFLQAKKSKLKLVNAKGKGIHCRTFVTDYEVDEKGKGREVHRPIYFVLFNLDLTEAVK